MHIRGKKIPPTFSASSIWRILSVSAAIFLCTSNSYAQWNKQATAAFPNLSASGGMLHFKNGVLWGGYKSVSYSLDTGKSWTLSIASFITNAEAVQNIDFFDAQTGLVRTNNYIYFTTNGGASWSQQLAPGGAGSRNTVYAGSPTTIISLASQGAYRSSDGGISWTQKYSGNTPNIGAYRSAGTIAIYETNRIIISTDGGQTWAAKPTFFPISDSYSFSWDPCDSNTLYLANEDYFRRNENWSEIFMTSDRGLTWTSKIKRAWSVFNGAMAISEDAAYFQTVTKGIFRTTDYGATWDSINGPSNFADTRWLVALTGNILVGVDAAGDVWRTDNSGGFPILTQSPVFIPPTARTIVTCKRDTLKFISSSLHCRAYTMFKAGISGPDSALFTLRAPNYPHVISIGKRDTVKIEFDSKRQPGNYTDSLRMSWQDEGGILHDSVFIIQVTVNVSPSQFAFLPPSLVFDTISPCRSGKDSSVMIRNTGCDSLRIVSIADKIGPNFSVDSVLLPILLPPDSSVKIIYHFHPVSPGFYTLTVPITAEWKGVQSAFAVTLNGRGTSAGFAGMAFDSLISLDTVSSCSPLRDSGIAITNLGCDTMRITSGPGKLGTGFSFDPLSFPIIIPPGSTLRLPFHFNPPKAGNYSTFAAFVADWNGYAPASVKFFLSGASSKTKTGQFFSDSLLRFTPVSACDPVRDTMINFTNRSCDTLQIISGPGNLGADFDLDGISYPVTLSPDSSITLHLHFHPSVIGTHAIVAPFITVRSGIIQNISLQINGTKSGSNAGPAISESIYKFDTVSTCNPLRDTFITMTNRGCDTLKILSGTGFIGNGFTFDPPSFPIIIPPDSFIIMHFYFTPARTGAYSAMLHFLTDRSGESDSIVFELHGYCSAGPALLSLSKASIIFSPISICSDDSLDIVYTNTGCDTLFVKPMGISGDQDFNAVSQSEKAIMPGDTVHIRIYFHPQKKGQRTSFYSLRYRPRFGVSYDVLLPISGMVTDGTKLLTSSLPKIDFQSRTLCAIVDTTITLSNRGCDTIEVANDRWTGSGFTSDANFPIVLLPGEDRQIHIHGDLDTAGSKLSSSAQLTFISTSDIPLPPLDISRRYSYSQQYPVRLEVAKSDRHNGDTVIIKVVADSIPNDLERIDALLSVSNSDMMTFLYWKSPNTVTMHDDSIDISGYPISAYKGVIAELAYRIYLSKDSISNVAFSNIRYNAADADYERCIAFSSPVGIDSVLYSFYCGERTIQSSMNNNLALRLRGIFPNPARHTVTIDLETLRDEDCAIQITDAKGAIVLTKMTGHSKGISGIPVDISELPSGKYIVKVIVNESALTAPLLIEK
jgi:photosystem II stability/assembly factor-like uncharacterized protein